jgi:hypothetical protein
MEFQCVVAQQFKIFLSMRNLRFLIQNINFAALCILLLCAVETLSPPSHSYANGCCSQED